MSVLYQTNWDHHHVVLISEVNAYKFIIDYRSYTHNLSSCEIKA